MVLPAKDYWLMAAREDTHFGEKTVPLSDKQGMVDEVFHSVAKRYDLMNDLMSGGLHRAWKDALVTAVNPPRNERPFSLLDVAGGNGGIPVPGVAGGGARARARPGRGVHVRRRQCRDAAVPGPKLRRLYDRIRHPQRAAHRGRA